MVSTGQSESEKALAASFAEAVPAGVDFDYDERGSRPPVILRLVFACSMSICTGEKVPPYGPVVLLEGVEAFGGQVPREPEPLLSLPGPQDPRGLGGPQSRHRPHHAPHSAKPAAGRCPVGKSSGVAGLQAQRRAYSPLAPPASVAPAITVAGVSDESNDTATLI